jgi:hypothetical protein
MTSTGEEWTAVTSAWSLTTGHGNGYRGVSVTTIDRQLGEHELLTASSFGIARLPVAGGGGETVMVEAIFEKDAPGARKR